MVKSKSVNGNFGSVYGNSLVVPVEFFIGKHSKLTTSISNEHTVEVDVQRV